MPSTMETQNKKIGDFYHVVYFWLKNPSSTEDRKKFENSLTNLLNVSKHLMTKHLGIPASTDRPVIDHSYTYSLVLSFRDKAEHDAYQIEDAHKVFISECEHLWQKVVVYDSENILNS
ncbi:MAG: Dabb family protein [Saprospiraceae bacterium]